MIAALKTTTHRSHRALEKQKKHPVQSRGNSRAAQNKRIRRDALREELKSREYLNQISKIDKKLQSDEWSESLQALKLRVDTNFRLLAKTLPDLKSVSAPVHLDGMTGSLTEMAERIITAMSNGELSPDDGTSLLKALASLTKVQEFDALAARVKALEEKYAQKT